MDYLNLIIRYGIMIALAVGAMYGISYLSQFGGSSTASADYRDMREIPRYSMVYHDTAIKEHEYQVGDMVVISLGKDVSADTFYAWVAGTAGDVVSISDGIPTVNGKELPKILNDKRVLNGQMAELGDGLADVPEFIVPTNSFYLLSDSHKHDSILNGLFPASTILGRVTSISPGE